VHVINFQIIVIVIVIIIIIIIKGQEWLGWKMHVLWSARCKTRGRTNKTCGV